MSDIATFCFLIESLLNREKFQFIKMKRKQNCSQYYRLIVPNKAPRKIRISDHKASDFQKWTEVADFDILEYKDLKRFQEKLRLLKG